MADRDRKGTDTLGRAGVRQLKPCVYCGLLTKRRDEGVPVCVGHADLPAIEKGRE